MSDYKWKTKKEIILENAQKDPFLKIEDLAKLADTTSRYVRTILSEGNISLMGLRKQYARSMENIYKNAVDKLLFNYLQQTTLARLTDTLSLSELLFNSPQEFNDLPGNIWEDYYYQSYLHQIKEKPWCVSTVFLDKDLYGLNGGSLSESELILELSNKLETVDLELSDIELEIELSTNQLARVLDVALLSPLFRVKQTIKQDARITALMLVYFNSKQITLSLSYKDGLLINRKTLVG